MQQVFIGMESNFTQRRSKSVVVFYSFILVLLAIFASDSIAEPIQQTQNMPKSVTEPISEQIWSPAVCTGEHRIFPGKEPSRCPKSFAVMFVEINAPSPPELRPLHGVCCELPPDTLSSLESYESVTCPPDFVVTGVVTRKDTSQGSSNFGAKFIDLICTKINTARYRLGTATKGGEIQLARNIAFRFLERIFPSLFPPFTVSIAKLPPALRQAAVRFQKSRTETMLDSYLGKPWGSLLVGRSGKHYLFSELQLNPVSGEGANIIANVPLYPECEIVLSPRDQNPICVKRTK